MSDVKKDHSIGAGTGAMAGAVTGAAIGRSPVLPEARSVPS